jgi:glycosyltransferase involved in cell wall biosynthesis
MKIGIVIYGSLDTLSGGYLYDRKLVDYLRDCGDTVDVISLPSSNYVLHLTDNLHFRLPPGLDLVIQDELNHPSLLAANRQPHRYPMISLVHHLRTSERRPRWQNIPYYLIEHQYLQSVDGFIFNSNTTRDVVQAQIGAGRPNIVAYPPTDRFGEALPAEVVRERAAESSSAQLRLLFLGSVIPRKGLHTLLLALSHVPPNTCRLDVVGSLTADPIYAMQMRSMAAELYLSSPVRFYGALDEGPLVELLKQSHLLVIPSSYEGYGIAYLEGMAFGLPAIGTVAGGAPEIISDGEDGYLIPPEDAVALTARLAALVRDRELLARLSLNALRRFQRQPTWNETAGIIRNFLLKSIS